MATSQSRLLKYQRRQALKTALVYFILTLAIIFLVTKFGTTAFTSLSSIFVQDKGSDSVQSSVVSPPQMDITPEITNNKNLLITGRAEPGATVRLTLNGQKQDILSNSGGSWSFEFKLHDGENNIRASVVDRKGNTSREISSSVVLDTTPPKLDISSPEDDSNKLGKKEQTITITGTTEQDASVKVNDRIAILNVNGEFTVTLPLSEGENNFTITSTDKAANQATETRKVNFSL